MILALGGCALPGSTPDPPADVNLAGYPLAFRQGYADGCATVRSGRESRDESRFASDSQYRNGWNDGRSICGRRR